MEERDEGNANDQLPSWHWWTTGSDRIIFYAEHWLHVLQKHVKYVQSIDKDHQQLELSSDDNARDARGPFLELPKAKKVYIWI